MKTKPYVEWDAAFSVENEQLDSQHQKMFQILNKLYDLVQKGGSASHFGKILDEAQEYAKLHFNCEEELLAAAHFPDLEEHKRFHREYVERVEQYIKRAKTENGDVAFEMFLFLKDWWLDHVIGADRDYIPFVSTLKKDRRQGTPCSKGAD
jgi:hemerythrin-like metal-binding protein